jgi:outer membrane lipoprotein-sorting protein
MRKKIIKTTLFISLIALIITLCLTGGITVKATSTANTLAELKKELADYKAKKSAAISNKNQTQSQITESKN